LDNLCELVFVVTILLAVLIVFPIAVFGLEQGNLLIQLRLPMLKNSKRILELAFGGQDLKSDISINILTEGHSKFEVCSIKQCIL
jgi:hypothetical protein